MAQSLAKVIVHIVFSTKDRHPFLNDPSIRAQLFAYLGGLLTNLDCQPIIIGGMPDHIHILCALPRTQTLSEIVKELKRASTLWLKATSPAFKKFRWQNGYGIFSIGYSQIETARKYIATQEQHHRALSFQDEFRAFLNRYKIIYDEKFLWD